MLGAAASRRPGWARIPLALARIDELEGDTKSTLEHLKQAVELGERQSSAVKRLVGLLDEQGRGNEADNILRNLEAQALSRTAFRWSPPTCRSDGTLNGRWPWHARPSARTRRTTRNGCGSPASCRSGALAEAEAEFEETVKIGGDKPEVWVAFVQHAVRRKVADPKQVDQVNAILKRTETALAEKEPLALALCYDSRGQSIRAEQLHLDAIKAKPADYRPVWAMAIYYQKTGAPEKAEPFLRQLLTSDLKAPPNKVAWARTICAGPRHPPRRAGFRGSDSATGRQRRCRQTGGSTSPNPCSHHGHSPRSAAG